MQNQKFDELHFFIAESGSFDNVRDTILIGGLLLFGKYDEETQNKLRNAMVDSLKEINMKYPQNTFFHDFIESDETKKQGKIFASSLAKNLMTSATNEDEKKAYSIIMFQNIHDIYPNTPLILVQRELDNRYITMIWSLIEHTIFVSNKTANKLNDNAKIHVHIAHRSYTLDLDKSTMTTAKELQLNMKKNNDKNKKNTYFVTSPIDSNQLTNTFNILINDRWKTSNLKLASIETAELIFDKKPKKSDEPTPGLYLANVILGIERSRLVRSQLIAEQTLPILESLNYDQNLDSTAICKSNYCNGNIESLIATIEQYPIDPNNMQNQELVRTLVKEYIRDSKQFQNLFESAKVIVDNPKNRKKGSELLRLLEYIYRNSSKPDLFADLYLTMMQFLISNQFGNIMKSAELWKTYIPLENNLPKLGVEYGLKIGTEFRCRRAISLTEQFNFDYAEQIMTEIGTHEETFCEAMAKFFQVSADQIDLQKIANCYDTLAQVFAFQAFDQYKRKLSELFFRKALMLFNNPVDQTRVWIHLGHLACDFPLQLKPLWEEAVTNLPASDNYIDDGIKMPFVTAVRLKGILVFGNSEQKKELAETMDSITRNYAYEVINTYPYGLILQKLAMLNAEIGNKKRANKLFEKTIRSLESGEYFSRSLSTIAKIRHSLFMFESNMNTNTNSNFNNFNINSKIKYLQNNIRQFIAQLPKSQITKQQSEALQFIDQQNTLQQAKRILNNIRFLHW
ncbi:MAG: hypothetical protein LBE18_13100 [Planctomycetaceae bacterium]|jgi:hypothetical protein|nr:hypothetical protein [Planctomycetaceae bacterium]